MKKQSKRNSGFVLGMVIILIALIAGSLAILSAGSRNMAFYTNRQYLESCRDNLASSAIAWAKHNLPETQANESISFDTSSFAISSELQLNQIDPDKVYVIVSCRRGTQTLDAKNTYSLESR